MRNIFFALAAIALSVLVCATNTTAALYNDWHNHEKQVFDLVNLQRDHNGLQNLIADSRLQIAADLHSQDMAVNDYFDHVSPDGTTHIQRIEAQGYHSSVFPGENIAAGYSNGYSVMYGTDNLVLLNDFDTRLGNGGFSSWEEVGQGWSDDEWGAWETYRSDLDLTGGWMGSGGHRRAILGNAFTDIGVGYYYLASDTGNSNWQGHYWTQTFAAGDTAPVPIPPSIMLFGSGILWVAGFMRLKKK